MEKTCPKCGTPIKSDSSPFCTNCGFSLKFSPDNTSDNSTQAAHETVVLETLDGYEFEKLCARIFQKLNYGTVEIMPYSGDEGRDLLINSPDGLIVVECKHQPHTSIGRPVVQKLHSAVISSKGIKGILVTSGKFSVQAVDHANSLSPKIELVDKNILADLATRSGIELILEGKKHTVLRYPISGIAAIQNKVASFVGKKCESSPRTPSDLVKVTQRTVGLLPSYLIQYDINSVFKTNVGTIHQEYLENGIFLIDGNSGGLMKQELANHIVKAPLAVYNESDFTGIQFSRSDFLIDDRTLTNLAKKIIIDRHTKNVSYYGRNNQHYSKVCVPSEKDVFISNVKQVYLPFQDVKFNVMKTNYDLQAAENAQNLLSYTKMMNCKICGSYIDHKGIVCNSCGAFVHGVRFLDPHGFMCHQCGKTICRTCTYDVGFNNKVCKDCAEKSGKSLISVSEKMYQRYIVGGCFTLFSVLSFFTKNTIIGIVLLIIGIIVLISDYRAKTPPYEII